MTPRAPVRDTFARALGSLRVSVTDRCNLRCRYCMPEEEYVWLPRSSLLTFEEIDRLVSVFAGLGVAKLRITGGEPLLRHDLPDLVGLVQARGQIRDIALTTNGVLLARHASALRAAGLSRLTVSLDTLRPDRFQQFARSSKFDDVIRGLEAAQCEGFVGTKINSVITRGVNDDEIVDLLEFARKRGVEIRFVEYMDVGGATDWSISQVVSRRDILEILGKRFGPIAPITDGVDPSAPAQRFRVSDGTTFGIIASTTAPFCATCDRSRLTADGMLYTCLYADRGIDLRAPVREGASDEEIAELVASTWRNRSDRGAEDRLHSPNRGVLYQIGGLRADPHREMHTRGG